MNTPLNVLLVEDAPDDARLVVDVLRDAGYAVTWNRVETAETMDAALARQPWDAVLCDYQLPRFNGPAALDVLRASGLDLPFIIVSGTIGEEAAVDAMRAGVHDYVTKDRLARLPVAVARELRDAAERRARHALERRLHEEEARFRALVERSSDGIAVIGATGQITYGSPSTTRILGYPIDEFVGRDAVAFVPPEDVPALQQVLADLTARPGDMHRREMRIRHQDGTWRWIDLQATNLLHLPSMGGVVVNYRDITERKQSEAALHASNERYERQRNALLGLSADAAPEPSDLAARLRQITETDARAMGVARVSIWRFNAARTAIQCLDLFELATGGHSAGAELEAARYPAYFRSLEELDVTAAHDAVHDPRTCEFARGYLARLGIASMLDATVRVHGAGEGVLCHEHVGAPRTWTADEQAFAAAIANLVALAIEEVQRHEVEQSLRHERDLFDSLVRTIPDLIYFKDRESRFVRVSDAMVRTFGMRHADEVIGRSDFDFFANEHAQQTYADEQRVMRTGEPLVGLEEQETWPDGRVTWASSTKIPWRDAAGSVIGLIGISRDITARKNDERRLREFAAAMDKAHEAIIVDDLAQRITFWNGGADRLFGWNAAEMIGQPLGEMFARCGVANDEDVRAAIREARDWRGEICGHNQQGDPFVIETSVTMLRDEAGHVVGRLSISTDITERKKLNEQLLRAQRLENIGMLAAGIAHDLNNVLAPIGMASWLLRSRRSAPEDLALLDSLDQCAERSSGLVRQILGFARGIGGEPRLVQVTHLLRDITHVIAETFPRSITLEKSLPSNLWPILANPTQIHQVLLNLCVNARDAMPHGGVLLVAAENCELDALAASNLEGARPGFWLVLTVQDSGTGIPPELRSRIWEPFFTTKSADKGTGLGLSTVRGIVTAHHGFITLNTREGHGTTFRVYLPAEAAADVERVPANDPPAQRGDGELILLVDDEAPIRETAGVTLQDAGYRVVAAADGTEAVGMLQARADQFALVITDLDMPGLNGETLARLIHAERPALPVLAMSGHTNRDLTANPGEFASAFLAKPFTTATLLREVQRILAAGRPRPR